MRAKLPLIIVTLIISSILAPLLISRVQAVGCSPNCNFETNTNVPSSEATVWVRVNGTAFYILNSTFSFANNTQNTIEVMNTTLYAPSTGAQYVFKQWSHPYGIQWDPTPTMTTPFILANYTSTENGPFVAEFDKQFQATLTFSDPSGQAISSPSSVTLQGPSTVALSVYSNQWLSAAVWTVTDATWQSMPGTVCDTPAPGTVCGPQTIDLRSGPRSAQIPLKAYSATVKVVDRSNNPVTGASVTVTLANATSSTFSTDGQGLVQIGRVPLGTYTVHVVYQNEDITGAVDASTTPVFTVTLNLGGSTSGPIVSAVVLLTIFGLAMFLLLLAIKVRRPPLPPTI
ncbi:MAG TPA: carboxypeptidase-like regulatory domain-containing protein [Candidatus Bathyarchaeia archaeon]